jgi:hypothetical protein
MILLLDALCVVTVAALNGASWDFDGPLTMIQTFLISGLFGFVGVLVGVSVDGCNDVRTLARQSLGNFGLSFAFTPLTVVQVCNWTGWPRDISIVAPIAALYGIGGIVVLRTLQPIIMDRIKRRTQAALDEKFGVPHVYDGTLLVVDDDTTYRILLERWVRRFAETHNLRVVAVASLKEAETYTADAKYLVTDWRLGTNEDVQKVESFIHLLDIPTLVITSASATVDIQPSERVSVIDKRSNTEPLPLRIHEELSRLERGELPGVGMRDK